jgi:drug/metabolite transporter (DMT)-like permease
MLRSTIFVYCALLALYFLKKKLYRHHWTSMGVIILGVFLVGLGYVLGPKKSTKSYTATDITIGLILLQVGQLFGAFAFVAEEKYLGDYEDLDPMLVVAYEGVAGFLLWVVVLPIFNLIPCTNNAICHNQDNVIESSLGVLRDYQANPLLLYQSLFLIFDVCILNIAGVSITKYGSAAQRTTVSMLITFLAWIFLLNVNIGESGEDFTWWQLSGFSILALGVIVYNEIWVVPFWGFNKNTKVAIEERERIESIE